MLILEANLIEDPLHEKVESDLQLTSFAVSVLDKMSHASTLMAMKRMNIVAAELDRRARLVISEARQTMTSGGLEPSIPRAEVFEVGEENPLQWDWGNDGVEAWPSMDFSIVSKRRYHCEQYKRFS